MDDCKLMKNQVSRKRLPGLLICFVFVGVFVCVLLFASARFLQCLLIGLVVHMSKSLR